MYVCHRCGYTCNRRNVLRQHVFYKKHKCIAKESNVSQPLLEFMFDMDHNSNIFGCVRGTCIQKK